MMPSARTYPVACGDTAALAHYPLAHFGGFWQGIESSLLALADEVINCGDVAYGLWVKG